MKRSTTKLVQTISGIVIILIVLTAFEWRSVELIDNTVETITTPIELSPLGKKVSDHSIFTDLYHSSSWKHHTLESFKTKDLSNAIQQNKSLFKFRSKKDIYQLDKLKVSREELIQTTDLLQKVLENPNSVPSEHFDLHQIKGKDEKGSVHFTGYYSPIVKVSRTKKGNFKYPFYATPKDWVGKLPTRGQIDTGLVLKGKQLEIAYAANPVDIYFLQVQGSGFIEFENGQQSLLSYNSNNKKRYRSIGRYMVAKGYTTEDKTSINSIKKYLRMNPDKMDEILSANPSYVFFKEGNGVVKGTGVTPLTAQHSIAVDPKYIPLGSTLLAKVPIADNHGKFLRHEYRLLFAQDTGGAINGPGHVDLFTGVGHKAKRLACNTHHYGELWLILPKTANTKS